jgi:hypothetical protein
MRASRHEPARVAARLERTFIRAWLASVALVATIVLLLDPLAQLGTGVVDPMTPNTRADRADRASEASEPPDCLILGSSRIMGIDPARLEGLLPAGIRCENAGVFTATVEDLEVQYSLWSRSGHSTPRYVFVGVEQRMFHPTLETDVSLVLDPRLRRHENPQPGTQAVIEAALSAVFGADTLDAVLRSVAVQLQPPTEPRFTMDERGALHWTRWENQIQRTGQAPAFLFEQNVESWTRWHAGFGQGGDDRWRRWQNWLGQVTNSGARLIVFLPPEDERLRQRVFEAVPSAAAAERAWVDRLERSVQHAGGTWLDLRDSAAPEAPGDDSPRFYDGIHPRPELADQLTLRLAEAVH